MWPFSKKLEPTVPRPDPAIGMQTLRIKEPDGRSDAGIIETDCNAIHHAYVIHRGSTDDLGMFGSYDEAVMAIKQAYNKKVRDWNFQADFGL